MIVPVDCCNGIGLLPRTCAPPASDTRDSYLKSGTLTAEEAAKASGLAMAMLRLVVRQEAHPIHALQEAGIECLPPPPTAPLSL